MDDHICYAGLYHSIYDTREFTNLKGSPHPSRSTIKNIIGDEAERLVYSFRNMEKNNFYGMLQIISKYSSDDSHHRYDKYFIQLAHLLLANWLEQKSRLHPSVNEHRLSCYKSISYIFVPLARDQLMRL